MIHNRTIRTIMSTIEEVYGDSPMNRQLSLSILNKLQADGWLPPEDLGTLIEAAGGEIIVSRRHIEEGPFLVTTQHSPETDVFVFRTRKETNG